MHVHLPKPLHGWREFLSEVGIIVLGILIALGGEQLVESYHWRERAREADQAIQAELYSNAAQMAERAAVQPCLREQIGALGAQLERDSDHWRGMALHSKTKATADQARIASKESAAVLPKVYDAPNRAWVHDRWDAAKSEGVTSHLPLARVQEYEFSYDSMTLMDRLEEIEQENASKLAYLATDRVLVGGDRATMVAALAEIDRVNTIMATVSAQTLYALESIHLPYANSAQVREDLADLQQYERASRGSCVSDFSLHVS
jgi:type II secretory pathway pseudopilin PulG